MTLKNIVFIDSRVAGYETLVAQLGADTEWQLLDAGSDGVEQMQRVLAGRTGLDSIQVVSHGVAGALYLGSTVLNAGNLGHYQSSLQAIGSSLSATGDILLYGCNVAQGEAGAGFVGALARITGADVAASDDATGPAPLGGDAELERASGSIEDVIGGAGTDTLAGGVGADSLYGGAADRVADIFDFNALGDSTVGTARDKVYDFVTQIDKIDLAGIDANTAAAKTGDQTFTFNTTTAKANAIWYKAAEVDGNAATKDIIVYGDINGNTTADFEIGLVGVTTLASGDFVL